MTREALEALTWAEITHPDDLKADLDQYGRMLAGEISSYSMDKRFMRKDGAILYTNLAVACVRNTGNQVEMILASYIDITDRKLAEAEIRNSRKRLAQIIDSLPDPTFVIDMKGKVTAWNQAMVEMTGIDAKDMIGRGDHEYALPFYGKRRPLLIDMVLDKDAYASSKKEICRAYHKKRRAGFWWRNPFIPASMAADFCPAPPGSFSTRRAIRPAPSNPCATSPKPGRPRRRSRKARPA